MRVPTHEDLKSLREFALSLPGAKEEFPFGHSVMKVKKKIFAFLGEEEKEATIALKLPGSAKEALKHRCCKPTGYGLGKRGWVTVAVAAPDAPSNKTLRGWIEESYHAVMAQKPSR